jgi:hypothetical protein
LTCPDVPLNCKRYSSKLLVEEENLMALPSLSGFAQGCREISLAGAGGGGTKFLAV